MAESLYRKYRPQIFEDVVGQEHIERTLKNANEHDKVSHAYLFCGPRGTGKTTTARLLAKALLCEKGPTPDPDGTCEDCRMIANGEHPDVNELDAASRTGVENVREEIIGRVQFAPTRGRYKVYIIDEVHMLSPAAFNALLKTLEEPPSHVVFILCTTDPQKVPETIHSRCQRFDFRRISNEALVSRLGAVCVAEGVEFEGEALDLIAHRSDGGMRNALTSLEQVIAFSEGAVTLESTERLLGSMDASDLGEIVGAIGRRDVAACFRWTAEFVETGADLAQFTRDLAAHVRNLYVMTLTDAEIALEVGASERREMEAELPLFAPDRLARLLGILGDLGNELKTSTNPRLSFEIALTRMVRPDSDLTMESLAERVEALESGYSAVAHVTSVPAGATADVAQAAMPATRDDGGYAGRAEAQAVQQTQPIQRAQQTQQAGPAVQAAPVAEQRAAEPQRMPAMERRSIEPQQTPQIEQRFVEPQPVRSVEQPAVQAAADTSAATGAQPQPAVVSAGARSGSVSEQLAASLSNPASLQRVWQAALTTLKKEKAAYGVLFLNTKAVFDAAAGSLSIEFPAENTVAFNAAQKPDVQTAVASPAGRTLGSRIPRRANASRPVRRPVRRQGRPWGLRRALRREPLPWKPPRRRPSPSRAKRPSRSSSNVPPNLSGRSPSTRNVARNLWRSPPMRSVVPNPNLPGRPSMTRGPRRHLPQPPRAGDLRPRRQRRRTTTWFPMTTTRFPTTTRRRCPTTSPLGRSLRPCASVTCAPAPSSRRSVRRAGPRRRSLRPSRRRLPHAPRSRRRPRRRIPTTCRRSSPRDSAMALRSKK